MADVVVSSNTEAIAVETTNTESIVVGSQGGTVTNIDTYNVVVEAPSVSTIVAGQPGPIGPTGLSEDSVAYARQTDFATETLIYKGEANAGSLFSAPVWRIRKIVMAEDGDVSETWADGNSDFDNIWDNRASLTYS